MIAKPIQAVTDPGVVNNGIEGHPAPAGGPPEGAGDLCQEASAASFRRGGDRESWESPPFIACRRGKLLLGRGEYQPPTDDEDEDEDAPAYACSEAPNGHGPRRAPQVCKPEALEYIIPNMNPSKPREVSSHHEAKALKQHMHVLRMAGPPNQALEKYARDLTKDARDGKLDPVIGRDEIIRRCLQV